MDQIEKAIAYAKKGIKIFPCSNKKKPLISKNKGGNGMLDATCDLRTVKSWWKKNPDALIGAPNTQFTVLDIDDYDLCQTGKLLTESAITRLKSDGILSDDDFRVKTMSGGTHVYFKKNPIIKRSIACLPNIDLLGDGGYVILPDQNTYVAINTETPWDSIEEINSFDFEKFSYVRDDFFEIAKTAKDLKKSRKSGTARKIKNTKVKSPMKTDISGFVKAMKYAEEMDGFNKQVGMIDYENNTCEFGEQPDMYQIADKDFVKADPTAKLLDEDGKIHIDADMLTSTLINQLFHNQEVQMALSKKLGLREVQVGDKKLMNSILPEHIDNCASMGIRWSNDKSHIIVRDFANFYANRYNHSDYNLIRLYATICYKTQVNRLSPAEFVAWFTRLLFEAGVIDLDHVMSKYYHSMEGLGKSEKKVAESFLLLDAIKKLYSGYDGKSTFADKFSAAWSGVSMNTVGKVKKRLVAKGFLEYCGTYDCSGGKRTDGFYETPLYRVVTEKKMKISGLVVDKDVREMQERRKSQMSNNVQTEKEKEVQSVYPNMGTIYGLGVTDESYRKLEAFCDDFDIDQMTMKKNMFMPIMYSEEFIQDVIDDKNNLTYFVNNFELVVDEPTDTGEVPLIAIGESPAYDNLWSEINGKHASHKSDEFEQPSPHFVLAYDIDEDLITDIDNLTIRFNEYVGDLSFQGIKTMYLTHEQMIQILDGKQPDDGD